MDQMEQVVLNSQLAEFQNDLDESADAAQSAYKEKCDKHTLAALERACELRDSMRMARAYIRSRPCPAKVPSE